MKRAVMISLASVSSLLFALPASAAVDRTVDVICAQNVVTNREAALLSAWSGYSANIQNAYSNRNTALHTAWGKTNDNDRKNAVKAAWNNYKAASTAAKRSYDTQKKNAWNNFRNAAKNCRNMPVSQDSSNESVDRR